MSLQNSKVITRPRVTICKMTTSVIQSVENRAKNEERRNEIIKNFQHQKRIDIAHSH